MLSANLVTAFGFVFTFWFVVGAFIYVALIRQINARRSTSSDEEPASFGAPEAILAGFLVVWFILLAVTAVLHPTPELSDHGVIGSLLMTVGLVAGIVGLLRVRGRNVETLAGLSGITITRAVATGVILLVFAYPLVSLGDLIAQQFLHGSSKQSIVELFNSSQTLRERVVIIIFAVTIAPAAEEFIFRFFIYGVLKRYFGFAFALVASALLFAAVHAHVPSLAALFILGSCFTIAYEWSGSLLASMTMHSLFNALTLVILAFPEIFRQ